MTPITLIPLGLAPAHRESDVLPGHSQQGGSVAAPPDASRCRQRGSVQCPDLRGVSGGHLESNLITERGLSLKSQALLNQAGTARRGTVPAPSDGRISGDQPTLKRPPGADVRPSDEQVITVSHHEGGRKPSAVKRTGMEEGSHRAEKVMRRVMGARLVRSMCSSGVGSRSSEVNRTREAGRPLYESRRAAR